jgi:hypothetical protein
MQVLTQETRQFVCDSCYVIILSMVHFCATVTADCGSGPNSYCCSKSDVFQNIIHCKRYQWRIQD